MDLTPIRFIPCFRSRIFMIWGRRHVRIFLRNRVAANLGDVFLVIDIGNIETKDVRVVGHFVLGTRRHLCKIGTRGSQWARNQGV